MRVLLLSLLMLASTVHAGTPDDPELSDPALDVERWPGVPSADGGVDLLAVWVQEDEEHLTVSVQLSDLLLVGRDENSYSYSVIFLQDGVEPACEGWGSFGVRADYHGTWQYSHWSPEPAAQGCGGTYRDLLGRVDVEGGVITMPVPRDLLGDPAPGTEFVITRVHAWSGATWPATPDDRADFVPGRPYVLEVGPEPQPQGPEPGPALEGDARSIPAPLPLLLLPLAALRRRA